MGFSSYSPDLSPRAWRMSATLACSLESSSEPKRCMPVTNLGVENFQRKPGGVFGRVDEIYPNRYIPVKKSKQVGFWGGGYHIYIYVHIGAALYMIYQGILLFLGWSIPSKNATLPRFGFFLNKTILVGGFNPPVLKNITVVNLDQF